MAQVSFSPNRQIISCLSGTDSKRFKYCIIIQPFRIPIFANVFKKSRIFGQILRGLQQGKDYFMETSMENVVNPNNLYNSSLYQAFIDTLTENKYDESIEEKNSPNN